VLNTTWAVPVSECQKYNNYCYLLAYIIPANRYYYNNCYFYCVVKLKEAGVNGVLGRSAPQRVVLECNTDYGIVIIPAHQERHLTVPETT